MDNFEYVTCGRVYKMDALQQQMQRMYAAPRRTPPSGPLVQQQPGGGARPITAECCAEPGRLDSPLRRVGGRGRAGD